MRFVPRISFALLLAAACVAAQPVMMGSTETVVPGAMRGEDSAGSYWATDMWIRCVGCGNVSLEFHPADSAGPEPTATVTVNMAVSVLYLPDVIANSFGLQSAFGNIIARSPIPVVANIRVYSNAAGGGSYGTSFMGMPSSMAMGAYSGMMGGSVMEHRFFISGLLPKPQARVDALVVNSSSETITGSVDVLDADGGDPASGAQTYHFSIQPYSCHQIQDILSGVHSRYAGDTGLQLRVYLDDGSSGMMMALAAVADNVTNSAYVVAGEMMTSQMMTSTMMPPMMGGM